MSKYGKKNTPFCIYLFSSEMKRRRTTETETETERAMLSLSLSPSFSDSDDREKKEKGGVQLMNSSLSVRTKENYLQRIYIGVRDEINTGWKQLIFTKTNTCPMACAHARLTCKTYRNVK
jgi:hypothetical protein